MNELFVFVQDNNYYGIIVVVAKTEEQARKIMEDKMNYDRNSPVVKYNIEEGLSIANYGDL